MKLLLTATSLLLFTCGPAAAATCDDHVIDNAGVLSAAQMQQLSDAAQPLLSAGADVHFITAQIGSMPDLDAVEKQMEQSCPTWISGGERMPGLLLFMVAPQERKSGIYYGSMWRDALSSKWRTIQLRSMNPHFRNADWAAGLSAGAVAAKRSIDHESTGSTVWLYLLWITFGVCVIWLAVHLILKRRKKHEPIPEAPPSSFATPYRSGSYGGSSYQAVGPTTVIHEHNYGSSDGFTEGLILGEILNDRPQVVVERAPEYRPAPVYESPSSSYDSSSYDSFSSSSYDSGGGSGDFGGSSDSGGGSGDF